MASIGNLPKPVLILEALGILLLVLAYLSINDYISLPAPLVGTTVAVCMVFAGIAMMVPAAVYLIWRVIEGVNPLFRNNRQTPTQSNDRKEKQDDPHD